MKQNNKPRVIIITGSIGTGKSTAVNIIKKMGYKVLDSDKIVHEGYFAGREMYNEVINCFGINIISSDGTINRKKLGEVVFNDAKSLSRLNEIVHKSVVDELLYGIQSCNDKVIFLDIPLALEEKDNLMKYGLVYDEIWLVYVNLEIQKQRLSDRALHENKNLEDVLKIINKQISIEDKKNMVDEVVFNQGTIVELKCEINKLLNKKGI